MLASLSLSSPPYTYAYLRAHPDVGSRSVGIGSDFDGIPSVPKGLEDVSKYANLVRAFSLALFLSLHHTLSLHSTTLRLYDMK